MRSRPLRWLSIYVVLLVGAAYASALAQTGAPASSAAGAKIWVGRNQEFEEFLKTAEITNKTEKLPVGVTAPKKIELAPGGLVEAITWKAIRPGMYKGYFESYKNEIAAYEFDKMLGLDMVPPYVERRIDGDLGAAVMWLDDVKSFKDLGGPPTPPPAMAFRWTLQIIRAKMFDNIIANTDPNLGNWLKDDQWNLMLIDHSRCFTTTRSLSHEMDHVDRRLWAKLQALDEPTLTKALGAWLGKNEVRAMLQRRDRMKEAIAKLVARSSEAAVFVEESR
jgi:hypothetical protein